MTVSHKNRVQMSVSGTPGTGTITLGSAASGYQSFSAAHGANATVDVLITDGTAWEVARGCTYTHSGTTLSRGTLEASSTGSAISLTSAAVVSQIATAQWGNEIEVQRQSYIAGLIVTKNSGGNTLDISAGSCYDPSSGKIISYAGTTGLSAGSLGASQWNQVYIYDSSGTATIEVVNNAAPPSSAYAGTARQGGTNSNRRWIGSFLTTAASAIYAQDVKETARNQFEVIWLTNPQTSPFRCLSAGSSTTYAAASLVGAVPRYVASEFLAVTLGTLITTATDNVAMYLSADGTNLSSYFLGYIYVTNAFSGGTTWAALEPTTPQIQYKMAVGGAGAGPRGYIDVIGYRASR